MFTPFDALLYGLLITIVGMGFTFLVMWLLIFLVDYMVNVPTDDKIKPNLADNESETLLPDPLVEVVIISAVYQFLTRKTSSFSQKSRPLSILSTATNWEIQGRKDQMRKSRKFHGP